MIKDVVKAGAEEGNTVGEFDMDKIEAAIQANQQEAAAGAATAAATAATTGEGEEKGREEELEEEEEEEEEKEVPQCPYSTIRVDLIVNLFSALVDKMNFDTVLTFLTPAEIAMLIFRLGPLNVFNTLKPEGCWILDMSRRDEKQFVKALTLLSFAEPGTYKMQYGVSPQAAQELDCPAVMVLGKHDAEIGQDNAKIPLYEPFRNDRWRRGGIQARLAREPFAAPPYPSPIKKTLEWPRKPRWITRSPSLRKWALLTFRNPEASKEAWHRG